MNSSSFLTLQLCIAVAAWQGEEGNDSIRQQAGRVSISALSSLTVVYALLCQAITEVLVFLKFRHFAAVEARFLRASFSAFVDLMGLVTKLVEEYGVAMEEHSWILMNNLIPTCSLELICQMCQPFSSVFLSQQISEEYFQPWLISIAELILVRLWGLWTVCTSGIALDFVKWMYHCIWPWLVQSYLEQWIIFGILLWNELSCNVKAKCTNKNRL